MKRILLTTTSFQDTPGAHHDLLAESGCEIVRDRGPLTEARMLELVGDIDAFICGDDEITRAVIEKARPRLKIISKYGIGVDKIDVASATEMGIPVLFTPGVNHTTVAEHAFLLLLALQKNFAHAIDSTRSGKWSRVTGRELYEKTIGIVGLGRIGKEVAIRARAFGLKIVGYDVYWDDKFAADHEVRRAQSIDEVFTTADYVSLHTNLTPETQNMVNGESIARMKPGVVIINCARGEIVDTKAVADALESGHLGGYGADVLDIEPPPADHPLLSAQNCVITPHVGSRTYESVVRQATTSVKNLLLAMNGEKPIAQVNPEVPIPQPSE